MEKIVVNELDTNLDTFHPINDMLYGMISESEISRILNQEDCDIVPDFLGFVNIYYYLSKVIPKSFTIIDFGSAYNAQCYFFKDFKKYISVDISDSKRFYTDNCELHICTIDEYIKKNIADVCQETTFAICNYVPNWCDNNMDLVKQNFKNVYTYYPSCLPSKKHQ